MKSRDTQKQKLLVVDDEPDNLDLLYRTFYREFKVLRAENGPTALDILDREGDIAVIISDQRMPMMSGTEFLSLTVSKYPDIIRIILTGYTDVEDLVEAINSGKVFKYVTKPWSDTELREVVKSAIDTHTLLKTRTEELRRTLQRESLLNAITSTIRSALSYDEILQTIVETIGKNFEVSGAIVCPFRDGEIQDQTFTYWKAATPAPDLAPTIWEAYQVESIPDVQQCDRIQEVPDRQEAYAAAEIHSTLMVPLICQQELIAILALHECGKSRTWQPEEIDLIHTVADQAALALSQAYNYEQVRALAKREALINTITTAIRSSLDPQDIFAAITQQLGQGLQVDGCALSLWTEDAAFVQCVGLHDSSWQDQKPSEALLPQSSIPIEGNPVLKQLIATQQPVVLSDLNEHSEFNTSDFHTPARALLVVPLITDGKIIGSISLRQNSRSRHWQASEIQLAQSVAAQAAIAVQQSRLYQTTRQQAEKLLQLDRAKTEFFQNISHELRTPLTLMLGPLETAVSSSQGLSLEQSTVALRNSRRLLRLVNQLLDLQRLDAGRMQPKFQPCNLAEFVRQIVETFRPYCEKKGLHLVTQLEPCSQVYLDLEKFDKVLYNLLSNAMKFTPTGESITVALEAIEDHCCLRVRDTGIGIREDQLPHLFERFRQAEGSENRSFEGTGLGLALVKELVELHNGEINVESAYEQGTTFTIELKLGADHLPPDQVVDAQSDVQTSRAAIELADLDVELQDDCDPEQHIIVPSVHEHQPTILVVDDNPDLRSYVSGVLRKQGYQVWAARNGAEGFEQARTHHPSLIVTDLMMPIVSGLDMIRMIRAQDALKGTPIILLTAKADEDTRIQGVERGADAYLAKPFNDRELLAEVRNLLALKENEQRISRINTYLTESVLSRFLPPTLVKRAAQGDLTLDLRPEPRMITVLFSDIVGFTQLSNTLRSRRVAELLNEYLTAMTSCVFDNGGTVDKFMGDAILAIFGAPEELTPNEQVRRAIATARQMYRTLDQLNAHWETQGIDRVRFRCGIHQGTAVVGMFGGEERADYTAIGPSVNIAARLQEAAAPGSILISAAVADYVDEDNITKESPLKLKGVDETVLTFSISPYPNQIPMRH
ncbi:response regulator [Leptolyngbya sp. FACHB-17]|uniref:response regulator n=1 Tax=unclassified Leptolyngbya TaxID=2650499 RepID=UPI0016819063|nr:response regulator [Leptolyngbya sp. FACHB-17]MBD2082114.1 response regulator [Leptolyngbya sp. FACHB-17]